MREKVNEKEEKREREKVDGRIDEREGEREWNKRENGKEKMLMRKNERECVMSEMNRKKMRRDKFEAKFDFLVYFLELCFLNFSS